MAMIDGIITKLTGGNYYVRTATNIVYKCRARGKFRNQNISPVVGDYVSIQVYDEDDLEAYIMDVKPRINELIRPKVANVDYGVIVISVADPIYNQYLLDKTIVILEYNNIKPVIIFTKICMIDESIAEIYAKSKEYYQSLGYEVFEAYSTSEIDQSVKNVLKNKTSILIGQTGVGKSTCVNNLDKTLNLEVGETSKALGRGRHTTRHTEIFYIDDIRIIDAPGFSAFDFEDKMDETNISDGFVEFYNLRQNCKFNTCIHINEPKCAVKECLNDDVIFDKRYENYLKMIDELREA